MSGCTYCSKSVSGVGDECDGCTELVDNVLRLVRTAAAGLDQPRPVTMEIMRLFFPVKR